MDERILPFQTWKQLYFQTPQEIKRIDFGEGLHIESVQIEKKSGTLKIVGYWSGGFKFDTIRFEIFYDHLEDETEATWEIGTGSEFLPGSIRNFLKDMTKDTVDEYKGFGTPENFFDDIRFVKRCLVKFLVHPDREVIRTRHQDKQGKLRWS